MNKTNGGIILILTAHQPAYIPWLGFFHKIAISDTYVVLDKVQFEKNSFINRNKIKTPNGTQWLTVPVCKSGYTNKCILDIEINECDNWERRHWLNLYSSYKRAPFFYRYADFFEAIYKRKWHYLIDLLIPTMEFFFKEMNIKTEIIRQSELQTQQKKQELIIEMCKKLNADSFVFGALGKNYAEEENFKREGIDIYFQDYQHPTYKQQWGGFEPYLSILDLLFNVGGDNALDIIMENNIDKKYLEDKVWKKS
jgi:hypothetical protein